MNLNLTKLPDLAAWSRRQVGKVNTGAAIFAVGFAVVGVALINPARQSAAALEPTLPKPPIAGVAAGVISGDALELAGQRIQLWGVVAPSPQTPQGQKAQTFLSAVVSTHRLVCLDTGHRAYDRVVARCLDPWGRDLAELMVRSGWAFDEAEYSRGQYAAAGAEAQQLAKGVFGMTQSAPVAASLDAARPVPADAASTGHVVPRLLVGAVG